MALETDIPIAPGAGGDAPTDPLPSGQTSMLGIIRKYAVGKTTFRLHAGDVVELPNIPPHANSAIMILEAAPDAAITGKPLARFWNEGSWPNTVEGMPMYDGAVIEVITKPDLERMRLISTDGKNHKINVQFYSAL